MLVINRTVKFILIIFLILEALLLTFGLPPFQKFDETAHFTRVIALSRGQLFCQNNHFIIPKVYDNLSQNYNFQKVLLDNEKFPVALMDFGKKWTTDDLKENVEIKGCRQNLLGYLPNTLGVLFTSWTSRPLVIFYAGRIFGFLFFISMLIISLKIINRKFQYLLWFYALMPMIIHQATAFSYDVVIISLILPLTALWINKITNQSFNKTHWILVALMVLVISIIKPIYLPLFFLFGLNNWNLKLKYKEFIAVALMAILVIGIGRIGKGEGNYPTFVNPKLQLQLIINDPVYFLGVVGNTWRDKWISHFEEMVGVMGWRSTPMLNNYLNFTFLILATCIVVKLAKDIKNKINVRQLIGILAVILSVIFLGTLAMYLTWSPVGDKSVEGIQGRYWLPLVPYWLVLFGGLTAYAKETRWFKNLILCLVLFGSVVTISLSLWNRYFDWSKNWINSLNPILPTTELMVIDKEVNLVKQTYGKNISAVALNLDNRNKSIIIPYQYQVMDDECNQILRRGYLSSWSIQGETQMVLEFKPIVSEKGKLCLKLIPLSIGAQDYQDRFTIKYTNGQPQMEWLSFGN